MRPNKLGGQTLENHYELTAAAVALSSDGRMKEAMQLILDEASEGINGNIIPEFIPDREHEVRVMNPDQTELVVSSLRRVAKGTLSVPNKLDELMAQSMIARLDGDDFYPKANRVQKAITRLRKMVA